MMNVKRLKKDNTLLVVIDFQEKLMPAMHHKEELEDKMVRMAKGAKVMGIPALVTQQYTKGLGPTIPSIAEALGEFEPFDKTSYSIMGDPAIAEAQSALDLLEEGYDVFICGDCVSSRKPEDQRLAELRLMEAGAVYTSMEAILFELCGGAKEPGFKEISAIIK